MIVAASPLVAQSADPEPRLVEVPGYGLIYVQYMLATHTRLQPRVVNVPGYGNVYVVPVQPKDTRTSRQRCIDEEVEHLDGSPSRLARETIDLKCSQR